VPYLSIHSFQWAVTTPIANLGQWQTIQGAQHTGLAEFGRVIGTAQLVGAAGGTLDLVLQTSYFGGVAGSWKDVARFSQLTAGSAAVAWTVPLTKVGSGTNTAPISVNVTDLAPTIAVNTIYPQSLGDSIRLICLPSVGTTAGAALVFNFNAGP
jgi:hypothetical protein